MADASELCAYIAASPSPYHCVAETARRLAASGYVEVAGDAAPRSIGHGDRGFVARTGILLAWHAGTASPAEAGFRIIGAHTDSPGLRLKPRPEHTSDGYVQWGVEPYGGLLLYTWLDRDLGLSGRVVVQREDGSLAGRLVRVDRPIARVPSLAIHLNREVNEKGLVVNKETHLPPVVAVAGKAEKGDRLRSLLAAELQCETDAIVGFDLGLHDIQAPVLGGLDGEFVFAPCIDNLASCYAALEALLSLDGPPRSTAVIALFDHEEVGSGSERGAASTLLRNVLSGIVRDYAGDGSGGVERALAGSFLLSVDGVHGVHPSHGDKHDKHHRPLMNGGPVVKTNVNARYSTDADTGARFRAACRAEGVPCQEFVNRADLTCGSTIGPIASTGLAVRAVDVGCAMLSMHSVREQMGAADVGMMTRVLARILREG